jgi:hypothetical protein
MEIDERRQTTGAYDNLMKELQLEVPNGYSRWIGMDVPSSEMLVAKLPDLIKLQFSFHKSCVPFYVQNNKFINENPKISFRTHFQCYKRQINQCKS